MIIVREVDLYRWKSTNLFLRDNTEGSLVNFIEEKLYTQQKERCNVRYKRGNLDIRINGCSVINHWSFFDSSIQKMAFQKIIIT